MPGRLTVVSVLAVLSAGPSSRLHAQCPDGSPPPCRFSRTAGSASANSVAVLYFENLSRDTTDIYLADGLTEDVTAKLGQVRRLSVTSRASVRRLHGAALMPTALLGQTLNVAYLVSGSVQRSGERLRVTVELLRAKTGERLWGDQYDRSAADVLAIQEDIARAVAGGIAGRLLPAEQAKIAARPTLSPEAYDHYLRGNRLMWRQTERTLMAAIQEYEAALRIDSTFAAARGRLAFAYGFVLNWSYQPESLLTDNLFGRAARTTDRAIHDDSTSSDAWLARSMVLFFSGKNEELGQALAAAGRAVLLNQADDAGQGWNGTLLRRAGRFAEAKEQYRLARSINPLNVQAVADAGFTAYAERRYPEARQWYDSAIVLDTTFSSQFGLRARVRASQGDLRGALDDATHALRLATPSEHLRMAAELAEMEARNGERDSARLLLQRTFEALGWPGGVPPGVISVRNAYDPALAAANLGMTDVAIAILEQARPRSAWLWSYLYWKDFDLLRNDPRFATIFETARPSGAPEVPP